MTNALRDEKLSDTPPARNVSSRCRPGIAEPAVPPEIVSPQGCRPSISTPVGRDEGPSECAVHGGEVGQAPAQVLSDHQPLPDYGPLYAHLDLTLEQLSEALRNGPRGDVYVSNWWQWSRSYSVPDCIRSLQEIVLRVQS